MPELPEVQTIVDQLADKLVGKKIVGVDVRLPKIFQGDKKEVIGAKIKAVERRAKIILLHLDNGHTLAVHLKMTGQLVYGEKGEKKKEGLGGQEIGYKAETVSFSQGIPFAGFELPGKTTHVIFDLDPSSKLFFNDMRQFGWVKVLKTDDLQSLIHDKHGPEPFSEDFTPDYLLKVCSNWGRPIKLLLMEQSKIAGIGNIYANEALWYAGISPMKRARDLAKEEADPPSSASGRTSARQGRIRELYDSIIKVLEMGIKYQGSSAADEAFVSALGEKGKMQDHFVVYQKQGTKCPRCGGTITVSRIGGRGTFFCPKCQK